MTTIDLIWRKISIFLSLGVKVIFINKTKLSLKKNFFITNVSIVSLSVLTKKK